MPGQSGSTPTTLNLVEPIVKPFSNVIKIAIAAASIATCLLGATPAVAAPVLLGNGTLNAVNDLTVVQNGGQVLEFLDLTSTQGLSVASALAIHGGDGFHWANRAEVATLYGAFGFAYGSTSQAAVILNVPLPAATSFVDYLGATFRTASLGWIDDFTTDFYHTYSCISIDTCSVNGFVENTASFWPSTALAGVYLVRSQSFSVTEPGSIAMISLALVGMFALRTRKSQTLG